jgi:hypothetical protein
VGVPTGGTTTPDVWLEGDTAYNSGTTQATNGQTVATWPDQSGNGNNATAGTAPNWLSNQLNGHAAISFNGSSTYLNNAYSGELGTVIVVYSVLQAGNATLYQDLLGANASSGNFGAYYFQASGGLSPNYEPVFQRTDTSDSGSIQTFDQPTPNLWTIKAGKIITGGTNTVTVYKHNLQTGTVSGMTALKTPTSPIIGAGWFGGSRTDWFAGNIAEIIIYSTAISDAERQSVVNALETKYGLGWTGYTYQGSFFQSATAPGGANGPGYESLYMVVTNDGKTFQYAPCDYAPTSGNLVRDPAIVQLVAGGTIWCAHTNKISTSTTSFDVASCTTSTTYGYIFNYVTSVDCSSITGSGAGALSWAPRWFIDPTAPQGVRILVALSSTGDPGTAFVIYEIHPTNAAFTTWSGFTALTGTGLPAAMIDPFLILVAGTYYLFYKNETVGSQYVELATSTSLTSGYTVAESGNWASWGSGFESPNVFIPPGGGYQILIDAEGNGIYWSAAATLTGFSGKTLCTGPFFNGANLQHGSILLTPPVPLAPELYFVNQSIMTAVF